MGTHGPRQGMSLLVRNLKFHTSPERVRKVFEEFGKIRDVYLPLDFYTKRPRGFGFVEFYDERDAEQALRRLDHCEVDGNVIEITMAQRGRSDPNQMRHRERKNYSSRSGKHRDRSGSRGSERSVSRSVDRRYRSRSPRGYRHERRGAGRSRSRDRSPHDYGRSRNRTPHQDHYSERRHYDRGYEGASKRYAVSQRYRPDTAHSSHRHSSHNHTQSPEYQSNSQRYGRMSRSRSPLNDSGVRRRNSPSGNGNEGDNAYRSSFDGPYNTRSRSPS